MPSSSQTQSLFYSWFLHTQACASEADCAFIESCGRYYHQLDYTIAPVYMCALHRCSLCSSALSACVCHSVTKSFLITVNHSDYNCLYAGQGAQKLKNQFKQARKHKKAIIFIYEVRVHYNHCMRCICYISMYLTHAAAVALCTLCCSSMSICTCSKLMKASVALKLSR
jgi:hypothetical protein